MTVQPIGAPDWLKGTPGAGRGLFSGNYAGGVSLTASIGTFDVRALPALAVHLQPDQDQVFGFSFKDAPASPGFNGRNVTCSGGAFADFLIPTLGPYVGISCFRCDALANPTGFLLASAAGSTDRPGGSRGGRILASNGSIPAGAATSVNFNFPYVAEGLATLWMSCTAASFVVTVQALDTDNIWHTIHEVTSTDTLPVRTSLQIPALACRLHFQNNDAATKAASIFATIGD